MPSRIRQQGANGTFPDDNWRGGPLLQVRVTYIAFLQGLFSAAPPGTFRWTESVHDTEIVISDENPINVSTVGERPCITISRGPVRSMTIGNDDMVFYDFETGKKTKSIIVPGAMSVNCCSRNDIESETLAWIVAEQLWMHREQLMRAGFFEIGRQFVISSPSPAGSIIQDDQGDEWYATTVSSPFQFYRTSSYSPLGANVVQHIGAQLALQTGRVNPRGPATGYSLTSSAPGVDPPLQPHPLNPAQHVVVRPANPYRPGIRPPSIGGRTIPIQAAPVEESQAPTTVVKSVFKV